MARSGYPDVNWFLRATRVVPVIAGTALLGGMIGGFAMFAIDSALTWEPVSQPRLDVRADSQASAVEPNTMRPVRIVGGAIPDPSAGMSGPPPAPRQQQPSQAVSSQLLTPKPLGPASRLEQQTATSSGAPAPQNQTANQGQAQTRWPDALSRAHPNAANATTGAQQQTAPLPAAQTSEGAANKNSETGRREMNSDRATTAATAADDQDRDYTWRRGRHSRHHRVFGANGWRNGSDDDAAASSPRRRDARGYDRLYDSYGNRRSYGKTREQSYGDASGNQDDAAARSDPSRSDMRRYGRDARRRNGSRAITREQPEETDRGQASEAGRSRSETFWGGGSFRRTNGFQSDDD
jgi:hypothetical protein